VTRAAFVPAFTRVTAEGRAPERWMLVLHGILGSGQNFATIARRLAAACPAWGFALVDLRMHGRSMEAPPPHTLAAAAGDLAGVAAALDAPVRGVMGHSFGGKVALAYAAGAPLDQAWVLDASPGVADHRPSPVAPIVEMLRAMPSRLPSRERFVELVLERGHGRAIAEWLAMNVRRAPDGDGFRLRLDLDAIDALIASYAAADLWPVLEAEGPTRAFHVVVAERSRVIDAGDRARLAALAARGDRVKVHLVEGAGHWVHAEAPDAVFALLQRALAATPA
jgi:pimeloyl-ACP methyl ester carboxylesterase